MPSIQDQLPAIPRPGPRKPSLPKSAPWTFALYIALLPVMQCRLLERFDPTPIIADLVFVVVCFLFVIALIRKEVSWRSSSFYSIIGFYAIAMLLSAAGATASNRHFSSMAVEAYLLAIAVLTFNLIRSEAILKLILQAWMVGTAITVLAAVAGIILFYSGARQDANIFLSTYGTLSSRELSSRARPLPQYEHVLQLSKYQLCSYAGYVLCGLDWKTVSIVARRRYLSRCLLYLFAWPRWPRTRHLYLDVGSLSRTPTDGRSSYRTIDRRSHCFDLFRSNASVAVVVLRQQW